MKRIVYQKLVEWKHSPHRKPLILEGARQVGKTWLMQELGKQEYKNHYPTNTRNYCDNITLSAVCRKRFPNSLQATT